MDILEFQRWFITSLTCLSILCWAFATWRFLKKQPLLEKTCRGLLPWNPEDALLSVALFILIPSVTVVITGQRGATTLLAVACTQAILGVAILFLLRLRYRSEQLHSNLALGRKLWIGSLAFVMWVPFVLVVQRVLTRWIPYEHNTLEILQESDQASLWFNIFVTFFSAAIVAPFIEEVVFRWVLQGWLQKIFHRLRNKDGESNTKTDGDKRICWEAIICTSLIFALLHGGQGPAPISLFILSLGIGYVFDRSGSLTSCVLIHGLLNGMTIIFYSMGLLFEP